MGGEGKGEGRGGEGNLLSHSELSFYACASCRPLEHHKSCATYATRVSRMNVIDKQIAVQKHRDGDVIAKRYCRR